MKDLLDECRRLFAPRPLPGGTVVPRDWRIELAGCRLLYTVEDEYNVLLNRGRVVWGARVQANAEVYSPGPQDRLGVTVYSPDPYFDDHPGDLAAVALLLYTWKGTTPPDPAARQAVAIITDEYTHVLRLQLPPSVTAGRLVYMAATMFHRRLLPNGYLVERIYPVLICPEWGEGHLVLPSKWWSPRLLQQSRATAHEHEAPVAVPPPPAPPAAVRPTVVPRVPSPPPLPVQLPEPSPEASRTYLQNPIRLTPAAAAEVRRVAAERRVGPPVFVRAALKPATHGFLPTLDVTAEPLQPGQDLFQETEGLTVAINSRFANSLAGNVIDVKEATFGKAFVFRRGT